MMSAMKLPSRRQAHEGSGPAWRPMPAWSWMLAAAVAVVITAFVVTTWLLTIAGGAKTGTDRANSRLDAVRTGLAAGAGAGAAVGLMLAFRRQHHQEVATDLTDRDATERRITDLYAKAVEQLGSDKAPVRLGGLYALERLAQDSPAQRPTIVNVICAYLRMPFPTMAPASKSVPIATENAAEPVADTTLTAAAHDTWQQERQVRLTAQRILSEHLRKPNTDLQPADFDNTPFWPGIRLDLTGATLIDFSLDYGLVTEAKFGGATFSGGARFDKATFSGDAVFSWATFNGGDTRFGGATFSGDAVFSGATFNRGNALFGNATFNGDARFDKATFNHSQVVSMSGRRDGALGRTAAADTRLSARATVVLTYRPRAPTPPPTRPPTRPPVTHSKRHIAPARPFWRDGWARWWFGSACGSSTLPAAGGRGRPVNWGFSARRQCRDQPLCPRSGQGGGKLGCVARSPLPPRCRHPPSAADPSCLVSSPPELAHLRATWRRRGPRR